MWTSRLIALAVVATSAIAQNLPPCANTCVGGDSYGTDCNKLDVACICKSSAWINGLACCVSQICNTQDQADTIQFANKICAGAGITTLPQSATCASTSSGASASAGSTSAGSSTTPATTTATTTVGTASAAAVTATSTQPGAANVHKAGGAGVGALIAGLAVVL